MAHSSPTPLHPDTLAARAAEGAGPLAPDRAAAALEERMAALEGGIGAAACTGTAQALELALATLAPEGGHVVAASGFADDADDRFARARALPGLRFTFVDARDPGAWAGAIESGTKLLVGETLADPSPDVLDVPAVAAIAERAGIPLLVDATRTTPMLSRPLDHGAHLVLHGIAGWIGGRSDADGAVLVDGGRFDWVASGRHRALLDASAGEGGIAWVDDSPVAAFLLRAREACLPRLGTAIAPEAAFGALRGLETLSLRMARHVANARVLADFLAAHDAVSRVRHPSRPGDPDHEIATRLYPRGCGGLVAFDLAGGPGAAGKLLGALGLFVRDTPPGSARSVVSRPGGATSATVRIAAGLEHGDDLLDDLARALKAAAR